MLVRFQVSITGNRIRCVACQLQANKRMLRNQARQKLIPKLMGTEWMFIQLWMLEAKSVKCLLRELGLEVKILLY